MYRRRRKVKGRLIAVRFSLLAGTGKVANPSTGYKKFITLFKGWQPSKNFILSMHKRFAWSCERRTARSVQPS
jgi:hypothetical protein